MVKEVESLAPGHLGDGVSGHGPAEDHHKHLVDITLDDVTHEIERGKYIVSALKTELSVPTDYELDQVVDGQFIGLADSAEIKIKGGEVFVSHVRRGGSS